MIMAGEVRARSGGAKKCTTFTIFEKVAPDLQRFAPYSHRIRTVFAHIRIVFAVFADRTPPRGGPSHTFAYSHTESHQDCECGRSSFLDGYLYTLRGDETETLGTHRCCEHSVT